VYLLCVCNFVQNNIFSIFAMLFFIYFPLSRYLLPSILQSETDIHSLQSETDIHCNDLGFRKILWFAAVDWN
jgi:hypothetical protein